MKIYRVGGAVRDRLLGRPIQENDYVVVGASPEELLAQGFKPVGKEFPVFLHPKSGEEYALARTERKRSPGYTGFEFYTSPEVTLEEDLKRRDLTINAIAEDMQQGELIDPYHGQADIKKKLLRHVSSAFIEDPVRVLRVARFMARFSSLGFRIAPETLQLMRSMVSSGELDALVPERIWREFSIALTESKPVGFVQTLQQCCAWIRICPEWKPLSPNENQRALKSLCYATELTSCPTVRFVALMKFISRNTENIDAVKCLSKRWNLPKAYQELLYLVSRYEKKIKEVSHLTPVELLDLIERLDVLRRPERFYQFLSVCEANWQAEMQSAQDTYFPKEYLLAAYRIVAAVSTTPLRKAGLKGLDFKKALKHLRVKALEQTMKEIAF